MIETLSEEKKIGRPKKPGRSTRGKRKRVGISAAMDPEIYDVISQSAVCGSFSMKLENTLKEWMEFKGLLVQYRSEAQKAEGTPALLNINAEKIYSCSPALTGYNYKDGAYEERVDAIIKDLAPHHHAKRSQKWVNNTLVPALRKAGFLVQVVDELEWDLYDVWIADPALGERGGACSECRVVRNIKEYLSHVESELPS